MRAAFCFLALFLTACAGPRPTGLGQWLPSSNFDVRRPNYVILHQTGSDSVARSLSTLTDPQRRVSAHYLISRQGEVFQLVDEHHRAWHAGVSWWGGQIDMNSASLGIELDNNGNEPFAQAQLDALLLVLQRLVTQYRIPAANIIAHGDIAPTRKVDPSRHFPWRWLAQQGYGRWCDPAPGQGAQLTDVRLGLKALGYDTTDLDAATLAFKRHFLGDDANVEWDASSRDMLACLLSF